MLHVVLRRLSKRSENQTRVLCLYCLGLAKDLRPFADLEGERRAGVVSRIVPFGVFVTVTLDSGAFADGLVHKSKIKEYGLPWACSAILTVMEHPADVLLQLSAICAYPIVVNLFWFG